MTNKGTVWAFDLGKGSIGEAVRLGDNVSSQSLIAHPG
jgi:hypothetical protein